MDFYCCICKKEMETLFFREDKTNNDYCYECNKNNKKKLIGKYLHGYEENFLGLLRYQKKMCEQKKEKK